MKLSTLFSALAGVWLSGCLVVDAGEPGVRRFKCEGSGCAELEVLAKRACTTGECSGCCDEGGVCQTSGRAACGVAGARCVACASEQLCELGVCLSAVEWQPDAGR